MQKPNHVISLQPFKKLTFLNHTVLGERHIHHLQPDNEDEANETQSKPTIEPNLQREKSCQSWPQ